MRISFGEIKRKLTANKLAISYIFVLCITYILGYIYHFDATKALFLVGFILFSIIAVALWYYAGVIVLRSLSLATFGISILFFLTQTYCELPVEAQISNTQAQALFGFGMIYAIFVFVISFAKEVLGVKGDKKNESRKGVLTYLIETNQGKFPLLPLSIYVV